MLGMIKSSTLFALLGSAVVVCAQSPGKITAKELSDLPVSAPVKGWVEKSLKPRGDRYIVEYKDETGKIRMALVSEKAFKDTEAPGYSDFQDEHWSMDDVQDALRLLIAGGTCRISGLKIPPMTPVEAKEFWVNSVYARGQELKKTNPAYTTEKLEELSRAYVDGLSPALVVLAKKYDPALKLARPDDAELKAAQGK